MSRRLGESSACFEGAKLRHKKRLRFLPPAHGFERFLCLLHSVPLFDRGQRLFQRHGCAQAEQHLHLWHRRNCGSDRPLIDLRVVIGQFRANALQQRYDGGVRDVLLSHAAKFRDSCLAKRHSGRTERAQLGTSAASKGPLRLCARH